MKADIEKFTADIGKFTVEEQCKLRGNCTPDCLFCDYWYKKFGAGWGCWAPPEWSECREEQEYIRSLKEDETTITIKANSEMVDKMLGDIKTKIDFSEMNNFVAEYADHIEYAFLRYYHNARRLSKTSKREAGEHLSMALSCARVLDAFHVMCKEHNFLTPSTDNILGGRVAHMFELCIQALDGHYWDSIDFCRIPTIEAGTEGDDED